MSSEYQDGYFQEPKTRRASSLTECLVSDSYTLELSRQKENDIVFLPEKTTIGPRIIPVPFLYRNVKVDDVVWLSFLFQTGTLTTDIKCCHLTIMPEKSKLQDQLR